MYVIIGSHFVPLKAKLSFIALVIVSTLYNIKYDSVSNALKCLLNNGVFIVHRSKPCCQIPKHFDNVISTCCENVVEVFESLTISHDNVSEWSDISTREMLFQ